MISNYLKIAIRNLFRHKAFSLINISGLAIGMASAVLIFLWIQNEMSFDRFHANAQSIYEIWETNVVQGKIEAGVPTPEIMAPILTKDVPEIEQVTRIDWGNNYLFSVGDKSLQSKGNTVDPAFLSIFSYPLLQGDPKTALSDAHSILLTSQLAKKLFGTDDVVGKMVNVNKDEPFKVSGILKELPNNTQFDFEWLMSYDLKTSKGYIDSDWTDVSIRTFALLKPGANVEAANKKIKNVIVEHSGKRARTELFMYPLDRLRLYSNFENGKAVGGRIERVRIFALIAGFILLIACINFMNLSTARSEKRAKEVGIRKVIGAGRNSLIRQFLAESLIMALIAGVLAILIVQLLLPAYSALVKKSLFIDYSNIYFWLASFGFVLITGLLAGSYPAFFLSSFQPVKVLKGGLAKINALITPRKVLVVLQFTFAIALIICTLVVQQQIQFAQKRETGYNKDRLGYVFIEGDIYKNYPLIKTELLNRGIATAVTKTQAPLTQNWSAGISMRWEGKDPNTKIQINRYTEDGGLVKTAGMTLVEGRDIDPVTYPSDSTACLISEAAVKAMGFKSPIGQIIFDDPINWHVVGVIKDFILESPYEPIKPFMVKGPRYGGNTIHVRLSATKGIDKSLAEAQSVFKTYNPDFPFNFHFLDEEYATKFSDEQLIGKLASLFAGLTIFISCLGLFGLATYMAENRIKEIGVRKVLGATAAGITLLLSKDFMKLIIVAILIASPLAWWAMENWLSGYVYRIHISWKIFVLSALASILIAIATISYQSVRAALSNPVKSLRAE